MAQPGSAWDTDKFMAAFTCNICGAFNQVAEFRTEAATCECGSNVRLRALLHLLSMELFGQSLTLPEFPRLKSIRGLGMTDKDSYASRLAEKFEYANTFYDREPRLDFTQPHPDLHGKYDFIIAADVLEHIAPPVGGAIEEVCRMLKPHGIFAITIFCNPADELREHFPALHDYRLVPLGDSTVLVNRRADGTLEVTDDLIFHGGSGSTLEMREFGVTSLRKELLGGGFSEVHLQTDNIPEIGVIFDKDVSQPLIARKSPFVFEAETRREMMEAIRGLRRYGAKALSSRWIRAGGKLGLAPKIPDPLP